MMMELINAIHARMLDAALNFRSRYRLPEWTDEVRHEHSKVCMWVIHNALRRHILGRRSRDHIFSGAKCGDMQFLYLARCPTHNVVVGTQSNNFTAASDAIVLEVCLPTRENYVLVVTEVSHKLRVPYARSVVRKQVLAHLAETKARLWRPGGRLHQREMQRIGF